MTTPPKKVRCRAKGCSRRIDRTRLMCEDCWKKLPAEVRAEITRSYLHNGPASDAFENALDAAQKELDAA